MKYCGGALQCAIEACELQSSFGELTLVIYYDETVPKHIVEGLSRFRHVSLVLVSSAWAGVGTVAAMYRFLGFWEYRLQGELICTWDLDNRIDTEYFAALLHMVRKGKAVFFALKKKNAPRARLFNADCWVGVPGRSTEYDSICKELLARMTAYIRSSGDTAYGCDERLQTQLVRYLLGLNTPGTRVIDVFAPGLPATSSADLVDYETTQRPVLDPDRLAALELLAAGQAGSGAPIRQVNLAE